MKASKTQTMKRPPIGSEQLERFFKWLDAAGFRDQGRTRIDARLLTISPVFVGVISELFGPAGDTPVNRGAGVALARRAVGTTDALIYSPDENRLLVVVDWMVRCALPLWFERLPIRCNVRTTGMDLRSLSPLLWEHDVIAALAKVSKTQDLLAIESHVGTAEERRSAAAVYEAAVKAMAVLTHALGHVIRENRSFRPGDRSRQTWVVQCAFDCVVSATTGALVDAKRAPQEAVSATLPQLERVLLETDPGDSKRTVASRCAWAVTKRRRAA